MENNNFHCANCDKVTEHWTDIATPRCIICDPPDDLDKKQIENQKQIENNSKKTQEQLASERISKNVSLMVSGFIWFFYSFLSMGIIELDEVYSIYNSPVEIFFSNYFIPIVVVSLLIAGIVFLIAAIFSKLKNAAITFYNILLWTSLIVFILLMISNYR